MKYLEKAEEISNKLHTELGLSATEIMFSFLGIMYNAQQKSYDETFAYKGDTYKVTIKRMKVPDSSEKILCEFNRFRKAFNFDTHRQRTEIKNCWLWRVFMYAMLIEGHPINTVARVIGKDHVTLTYHLRKVTENEKNLAKEFASNKNYVYNEEAERLKQAKRNLWYGAKKC